MFHRHLVLIFVQLFAGVFAGVYNEFLLKDKGVDVPIMLQNIFMYFDSILCSIMALGVKGDLTTAFSNKGLVTLFVPTVIAIMINNSVLGIVTSLFLRSLNSIVKTFASALELMFLAVLCWIIFGIPVDVYTFISIFIVSAATLLYAQKPVVNLAKTDMKTDVENGNGKTLQK